MAMGVFSGCDQWQWVCSVGVTSGVCSVGVTNGNGCVQWSGVCPVGVYSGVGCVQWVCPVEWGVSSGCAQWVVTHMISTTRMMPTIITRISRITTTAIMIGRESNGPRTLITIKKEGDY